MVQLLYIRALWVHKWGVDTKIKILQCCISKLQAFARIVAGYPIATTQNCIYFRIGMRYPIILKDRFSKYASLLMISAIFWHRTPEFCPLIRRAVESVVIWVRRLTIRYFFSSMTGMSRNKPECTMNVKQFIDSHHGNCLCTCTF